MRSTLFVAAWLFVATHLDTFVVLVAFCVDDAYDDMEVFVGHYVGFSVGLAAAVVVGTVAGAALQEWTFLLGIVPLAIGIWGLYRRGGEGPRATDPDPGSVDGPLGEVGVVATVGVGLSGENLAVFVPFFGGIDAETLAVIVALYVLAAGALFGVALALARRPAAHPPAWVGSRLVPGTLIVVGLYVLGSGIVL